MENIYDVIVWGQVVTQGHTFFLLAPKPYHSEMADGKVGHSVWQPENTLKWEVAGSPGSEKNEHGNYETVYERSIIVFGSDFLIEFFQDPYTIKVKYIIPSGE